MSYLVLAVVAVLVLSIAVGCKSSSKAADLTKGPKNSQGVPVAIADAKLLRYSYTLQGTMRWPLHSECVEICPDDSTRCIVRLFDDVRFNGKDFDENGEPVPETLVVSSAVLDTIKQMIIDAKAWRFKENYSPREATKDGTSWGFSASFAATDSALAAAPVDKRARLLRNGGCNLASGGDNAAPDTRLFKQVKEYLWSMHNAQSTMHN